ncbi:MAG: hypothetical protein ACKOF3_12750 [Spartobacteria bacterium]
MPARQRASPVAAVCDRRMENKLGAQRRKLTVEALCERLRGTIRQSQTAATGAARATARIDFLEGQRPRLTQISSTENSIFLLAADL